MPIVMPWDTFLAVALIFIFVMLAVMVMAVLVMPEKLQEGIDEGVIKQKNTEKQKNVEKRKNDAQPDV
jgi:hypothetical protein